MNDNRLFILVASTFLCKMDTKDVRSTCAPILKHFMVKMFVALLAFTLIASSRTTEGNPCSSRVDQQSKMFGFLGFNRVSNFDWSNDDRLPADVKSGISKDNC